MPAHTNWLLFLGRLHPLLVHLPIGFLAILAAVELAASLRRFRGAREARGIILAATAAAAVLSVVAGLMLSTGGGYDPSLLRWHKWTGITLAAFVVFTALAHWRHKRRAYVGLLIATLALLGPASHFGGSMTHGADYLTAYAPGWVRAMAGAPNHRPGAASRPAVVDAGSAKLFGDLVHPVLVANCVSCHGPDRSSGRLRLDTIDLVRRGGQSGPSVVPGDAVASLLVRRLTLPTSDPRHMPPADQAQPSADEVDAVRWWVATGAADVAVASVQPTGDQLALVGRLLHVAPVVTGPPAADAPRPWAEVAPGAAAVAGKLGVSVHQTVLGEPWVEVSGRTARRFGDAELASLAPLGPNITSLDLAGSAVTDAGLAAVASMPNLRQLHLERTHITDAGLAHLRGLPHLAYLNLYGTAVTDAGAATLGSLPALDRVYLWRTGVTPAAAAALAAARVDPARAREWQQQIDALQAKIAGQHITVEGGIAGLGPARSPPSR